MTIRTKQLQVFFPVIMAIAVYVVYFERNFVCYGVFLVPSTFLAFTPILSKNISSNMI